MINESLRKQLTSILGERLRDEVRITYFTQGESPLGAPAHECDYCQETGELWQVLAGLNDKITLDVRDLVKDREAAAAQGVEMIPASILSGHAQGTLRYFGVPSGYEFGTVVESLVDLSTGANRLSARAKEALKNLTQPIHIQVFVTPT